MQACKASYLLVYVCVGTQALTGHTYSTNYARNISDSNYSKIMLSIFSAGLECTQTLSMVHVSVCATVCEHVCDCECMSVCVCVRVTLTPISTVWQ